MLPLPTKAPLLSRLLPAGAEPLGAACEGQRAEPGLVASLGPRGCPGPGAVAKTPVTRSSVPAEPLQPCGG